ncbi:hypothetical protein [Hymenobacter norwichensis]|uniref:hypothetical protein n=1 Tax=Hymenobacter norwichensis TaxID=223903 RepID=UPI0003B54DA8|nr:hypothetical protein [Hymenobacter norwichensis]
MTPAAQGRHCAACDKVVLDFTQKTDAEILALLKRTTAPCGRFRADQLGRPLLTPPVPTPRWRTWLAAAATLLWLRELATQPAAAQRAKVSTTKDGTRSVELLQPRPPQLTSPTTTELRGWVRQRNAIGVPNAFIHLDGTTISITTAPDGSFILPLPAGMLSSTVVLTVSASSFAEHQMAILLDSSSTEPLIIQLYQLPQPTPTLITLGGLAVAPVIIRSPEP